MLTAYQLLTVLDGAIGGASRRWRDRDVPILRLTGPTVLGQTGREIRDDGTVEYGYNLSQCEAMREAILEAAAADARDLAGAVVVGTDATRDTV
jgi:hypothetical protein